MNGTTGAETTTTSSAKKANTHYNAAYAAAKIGSFQIGGVANLIKFQPFIHPGDKVVDFGCGGGYLLKNLQCGDRLGVEINEAARALCAQNGIRVVPSIDQVPLGWADVIVSNHALEHVDSPWDTLIALRERLAPGGRLVLVVPCEGHMVKFVPNNIDQHLFTWSPLNLGNLVHRAGFEVEECKRFWHLWPPKSEFIIRQFGWGAFHLLARITSRLRRRVVQIRAVARVPVNGDRSA